MITFGVWSGNDANGGMRFTFPLGLADRASASEVGKVKPCRVRLAHPHGSTQPIPLGAGFFHGVVAVADLRRVTPSGWMAGRCFGFTIFFYENSFFKALFLLNKIASRYNKIY